MNSDYGTCPAPAELADRLAILDILALHSRGLDRCDSDTLSQCYWPEGEVDYGSYKGPAQPFTQLVTQVLAEQYELTRHGLGNHVIEIAGDRARCETCVSAGHLLPGGAEELHFFGRYLDRLEKRGDCWKILHRQVVMDWSKRIPVVDERDSEAFAALSKGRHAPTDPLYPFLSDS